MRAFDMVGGLTLVQLMTSTPKGRLTLRTPITVALYSIIRSPPATAVAERFQAGVASVEKKWPGLADLNVVAHSASALIIQMPVAVDFYG